MWATLFPSSGGEQQEFWTPTMSAVQFEAVVSSVYEAATGGIDWPTALDHVASHFGASIAVLQQIEQGSHRMLSHQWGGNRQLKDAVLHYVRQYHRQDPRAAQLFTPGLQRDGWYHSQRHLKDKSIYQRSFFRDYLAAYGGRHLSATLLAPSDQHTVGFGLEWPAQRATLDEEEHQQLARLGTHLAEALRLQAGVRRLQLAAFAGQALLQGFAAPMWLLEADRTVRFANDAAVAACNSAGGLVQRGGLLGLLNLRADSLLTEQLHALSSLGHGATAVLQVPLKGAAGPLWLHLSLLVPEQVLGAFGAQPLVLATLFDPAATPVLDRLALACLFNLSPTQAQVACLLAEGQTPNQIASVCSVALATVRSHLHTVLRRVGAQRSEELVRLLHDGHRLCRGLGDSPMQRSS
jgi:DNA-binding CsgD family transcriptional regulator